MFELFRSGAAWQGWLILGIAWAVQVGLLILAVLGRQKWQWRLMFTVQSLSCISAFVFSAIYNHIRPGYLLDLSYLDDTLNTLLAGVLYCVTLLVSWVFWVNRKPRIA